MRVVILEGISIRHWLSCGYFKCSYLLGFVAGLHLKSHLRVLSAEFKRVNDDTSVYLCNGVNEMISPSPRAIYMLTYLVLFTFFRFKRDSMVFLVADPLEVCHATSSFH